MKSMKVAPFLSLSAALCLLGPMASLAQQYTYSPPSSGAAGYPGVAPTLPPPAYNSGYAAPSFVPQQAAPNYGFQQPAPTNSWAGEPANGMAAGASMLNYNYVDGGYRYVDPKGGALDGSHGLGATMSFALFQPFFIKGGFNWTSGTGGNTVGAAADADYSLSTISIAAGAYMPITQKLHFVGEVGLVYANMDASSTAVSYTDAGVYVRPSLRYQALDILEIQGGVTVNSTSEYDSKVLDLGAYLRVMPQLDLNLGADFGDQNRTMKAGVRLRW
jgi:hypothetical protein